MTKAKNKKTNTSAFTLIEMMVSILVFSLLMVAVSGIFISGVKSQRRALATQVLLDQVGYAMEVMSRSIRMASKQIPGMPTCIPEGTNYEIGSGGKSLKFINHLEGDDCQMFFWDETTNKLEYKKKIGIVGEQTLDLTSDDLVVTKIQFKAKGESQTDDFQPKITALLNIRWGGPLPQEAPTIRIQTTVSQRNLDIRY